MARPLYNALIKAKVIQCGVVDSFLLRNVIPLT